MEKTLSIIFGFGILYLFNLFVVGCFLFAYLKISKKKLRYSGRTLTIAALQSLLIVLVNSLSLILFSSNIYLFSVASFLLLLSLTFLFMYKVSKEEKIDSLLIALSFAIIMNPVWFKMLGIM